MKSADEARKVKQEKKEKQKKRTKTKFAAIFIEGD